MTKRLPALRRAVEDQLLEPGANALPIYLVATKDDEIVAKLTEAQRKWIEARDWTAKAGSVLTLPGADGAIALALLGTGGTDWAAKSPLLIGILPGSLPQGDYRFASTLSDPELATLAWLLGAYRFNRYKRQDDTKPSRLVRPDGVDRARVLALAEALYFARDIINTPANDFGPAELESAAREIANEHCATVKVTEGSSLLSDNFPMIHAVGRASDRAPRLIDFRWGSEHALKLTILGKGICFDTGGLDIKPSSGMVLMKKDMGGAASALAIAHMVMSQKLPVRLRVLIPAADNSIAGNAFRPGDVLPSRNGMTVEIGNTDAEGRLVLADAIALADEQAPDTMLVFATLTGAARVALGPDVPAFFCDDDAFAAELTTVSEKIGDPVWRLPFWPGYDSKLESSVADMNNIWDGPFAGAIVAALFLKRFVKRARRFAHFDIYGWRPSATPLGPKGGEPQAARALFAMLRKECAR
jgi:leucyl aminopeptidase